MNLLRSWLYAAGNKPRHLAKVFDSGADAVIIDLEDAVPPAEKADARRLCAQAVARHFSGGGRVSLSVRVNRDFLADDIAAAVQPGLDGLRLTKVEDASAVLLADELISKAEAAAGLDPGSVFLVCALETAAGVLAAASIAASCSRVRALGFGASDFALDVNAPITPHGLESLYARSHLVLASRAAGIAAPIDGVHPNVKDLDGLALSTRRGRELGFFGRTAIHPTHVPVINSVFTPTSAEVDWAHEVIAGGDGAFQISNGDFVDLPIRLRAARILALAERLAGDE
jgi:citrate lyase subunit beta / citryl-CoA lyase